MISPIQSQSNMLELMQQMQHRASSELTPLQPAVQANPEWSPSSISVSQEVKSDFRQVIHSVNQQQNVAAQMMHAVDTGASDDVVGAMVASQKADLSFSMLLQIRNKVLSGIDDVMRMSL